MPYSLSPSLPVMQVGSVRGRFPHLHILWGFFLLLKKLLSPLKVHLHLRWTFRGGLCKQQVKPIAQEGVGVLSITGLFLLEFPLSMIASQTKIQVQKIVPVLFLLSCYGKGWNVLVGLWSRRNLQSQTPWYHIYFYQSCQMDLSDMSCSQAIFIIV